MNDERNRDQIVRKGRARLLRREPERRFRDRQGALRFRCLRHEAPLGQRQTDCVHVYMDVGELLELCREAESGELRAMLREKRQSGERGAIYQHLGGTPAERLASLGRERADGMSLSRTFQLLPGAKSGFLLVADSGAGEENSKGLIVPRFGNKPENHVAVCLSFAALCELLLMTRTHYQAWLTAQYAAEDNKNGQRI